MKNREARYWGRALWALSDVAIVAIFVMLEKVPTINPTIWTCILILVGTLGVCGCYMASKHPKQNDEGYQPKWYDDNYCIDDEEREEDEQ